MTNGFLQPAPQQGTLGKIGLGLQAFGAGVQGRGPEFLALQQEQGQALSLERQKAAAEDLRRAQLLMGQGDLEGIRNLAQERTQLIQQLGGDPSDTMNILQLTEASIQGDENAFNLLNNEINTGVQLAAEQGLIKLPQQAAPLSPEGKLAADIKAGFVSKDDATAKVPTFTKPQVGIDEEGKEVFFATDQTGTTKVIGGITPVNPTKTIKTSTETIITDRNGNVITRFSNKVGEAETVKTIAREEAKVKADRKKTLPKARQSANQIVNVIDQMIGSEDGKTPEHRGLRAAIGPVDARTPDILPAARSFVAFIDQLRGKTFLEAFQQLKGGGTITEVEGTKAEQSMARLDRAQEEPDFIAALAELRGIIKSGLERHEADVGDTQPAQTGPLAQQFQEGQTATGPSGEKVIFRGGQWQPI